jgi:3-hydroxy-5-methyl-1-naphthoate 3-O-methyltransferase
MDFSGLAAMAGAHGEARAIQTAVKLGLFEALDAGSLDAAGLARALGCDPWATGTMAAALASMGLLEVGGGRYSLSAAARRYLLPSSDEYLGGMILFEEAIFPLWSHLEDAVRSGKPARAPDMFQSDPAETALFIRAMDSLTRARGDARWVAENLDLARTTTLADLGGGPGTYVAAMLRRNPALRGYIWDLPATLAVARTMLAEREAEVASRIELVTVDYLRGELPGPVDAIFLSNIIHSEDERTNAELMRKCGRALARGGIIAIKDHVMNSDFTEPRAGAIFSLYLLLTTRGRDYSLGEISGWLATAGFADVRMQRLPSPPFTSSLVTARKP